MYNVHYTLYIVLHVFVSDEKQLVNYIECFFKK